MNAKKVKNNRAGRRHSKKVGNHCFKLSRFQVVEQLKLCFTCGPADTKLPALALKRFLNTKPASICRFAVLQYIGKPNHKCS